MNAPLATPTAETFSLKRRQDRGGTPAMNYWGCKSEYGVLTDVLLGKAEHIKHLSTSSLSRKYLRESPCNIEVAKKQHAELISAYDGCRALIAALAVRDSAANSRPVTLLDMPSAAPLAVAA